MRDRAVTLSEAQIQRYSRQILLREVGGIGQVRLLSAGVELRGTGAFLEIAASYLAAGGCPVRWNGTWVEGFDPEAARDAPVRLVVGAEGPSSAAVAQVRVGWTDGAPLLAYRAADGCDLCFTRLGEGGAAASESTPPTGLLGTLAALIGQALLLGRLVGVGAVRVEADGTVSPVVVARGEGCTHG